MSRGAPVGRFQIEAAIQSVHCARAWQGTTDIAALRVLHAKLEEIAPTIGARCAHAAVVAEAGDPKAALAMLDAVEGAHVAAHGPYWATRGAVLARLGLMDQAGAALRRAAGLADDPAVRAWLLARA
jgi:RNA polymerase sigma-70 factor (ECF subfamily)